MLEKMGGLEKECVTEEGRVERGVLAKGDG